MPLVALVGAAAEAVSRTDKRIRISGYYTYHFLEANTIMNIEQ